MKLGDGKPKPHGTWDWFGSCDPQHYDWPCTYSTFSVGVFQWVQKSKGRGTRKSKIVKRVIGSTSDRFAVYADANAECEKRQKGDK